MSIFKDFVLARPVKTPLDFGHNENIVIETIDFNERKRKGIKVKANTFIKLAKLEPKTKEVIANTEISFWDLDPSKDFVYDNFISQFSILSGIIDALGGDVEQYETEVLAVVEGDSDSEILAFLKKPANAKQAQNVLVSGFKTQIEDKIGLDSTLLKCKMISNKAGYLLPANDIMWVLPMESENTLPIMTSREKRVYEKSFTDNTTAKPDTTGNAPKTGEAPVASSAGLDSI